MSGNLSRFYTAEHGRSIKMSKHTPLVDVNKNYVTWATHTKLAFPRITEDIRQPNFHCEDGINFDPSVPGTLIITAEQQQLINAQAADEIHVEIKTKFKLVAQRHFTKLQHKVQASTLSLCQLHNCLPAFPLQLLQAL